MKLAADMVAFDLALVDKTPGQVKIQRTEYLPAGALPIIDQGQKPIAGYTDDSGAAYRGPLPVILFGDHTLAFKFVDFDFALGADGVRVLAAKAPFVAKFIYYYLISTPIQSRGYSRHFKFLREVKFPHVAEKEQRRVVGLLEQADRLRHLRAEADKLADSILPALFQKIFGDPVTNPNGWPRKPLGEITAITAPMVDPREPEYMDLPHVGPDRIEGGNGRLLPCLTAREEKLISGKYLFDTSHVLYSKIRPYLRKVALPEFSGLCSADMYPVSPLPKKTTREFLWALLLSSAFTNYTSEHSGRANMPKLNREQFAAYDCAVPPFDLQCKFSNQIGQLRQLESKRIVAHQNIETLFATMLHRAFTGELTAKWREAHLKELLVEMEHQAKLLRMPANN